MNAINEQWRTFTLLNEEREGKYTPLFFDLADTNDQSRNGSIADFPRDRVSGYTTAQMQHALRGATSLQDLHDKLYTTYRGNRTRQHLQDLIDSYSDNLKPVKS